MTVHSQGIEESVAAEEVVAVQHQQDDDDLNNVFRLPKHVQPINYKLRIVTHLGDEEGFKFTGKVWIKVSRGV